MLNNSFSAMSLHFHLEFCANPVGTKYLRVNYCQGIIWVAGFSPATGSVKLPRTMFFSILHSPSEASLFVKIWKFRTDTRLLETLLPIAVFKLPMLNKVTRKGRVFILGLGRGRHKRTWKQVCACKGPLAPRCWPGLHTGVARMLLKTCTASLPDQWNKILWS